MKVPGQGREGTGGGDASIDDLEAIEPVKIGEATPGWSDPVEEIQEDVVVEEDSDESDFEYSPDELPIDPSQDGDVIGIIQTYEEEYTWEEVPILPNMDASPSIFQSLTMAGNVDVNSTRLYAQSEEDISSEFFLRVKDNTRVTFDVRIEYSNKAVDRNPLSPSDWAEEFDLVLESGDSVKWDVPKQESADAWNLFSIDNPQDGMLSIVVNGNERIDQSSPFQTYHQVQLGNRTNYRARGEISIRMTLKKYEIATGIIIDDPDDPEEDPTGGGGGTVVVVPIDDDDLFSTTDILLGLGVMLLLGIYLINQLDLSYDGGTGTPAVA